MVKAGEAARDKTLRERDKSRMDDAGLCGTIELR